MLDSIELDIEKFKQFDYMLYEQRFFENVVDLYDAQSVKYIFLAEDIFRDTRVCPILVDLNSVKPSDKESFFEDLVAPNSTRFMNRFDFMYISQVLIRSSLSLDEMADFLITLMMIGTKDKYLFRFFDPRVAVHLNAITFQEQKLYSNKFHSWRLKFIKYIGDYTISINGEFRKIALDQDPFKFKKALEPEDVEKLNTYIKSEIRHRTLKLEQTVFKDTFNEVLLQSYKAFKLV